MKKELSKTGMKSTAVGILFSFLLVIIKGAAGFFGNSYALIADAIESSSDILTSIIVLIGLKIATKPPDEDHPYGHGKAEPIAGMVVSISLFIAAAVISYQSIREIIIPHHAPEPFTLWVLVIVVIIKESLFRYVFSVGSTVGSIAVRNDAWHHRSDAITSLAVFIGISIALIGGKGYEEADDWAALVASCIIIFNASRMLKPAVMEIMDAAPSTDIKERIINIAREVDGVIYIDKCFVRKMGFEFFVDIHIIVDGNITVHDGHLISHKVKDKLKKEIPRIEDVLIHIEPNFLEMDRKN
ncbi:MAG TPA: cation diffusion facilitator family transporter [Ignavibacteriaceae bacterium]|nr:cation diffusion facilitator family transporter [Ignavibacteriaceae bacterium]